MPRRTFAAIFVGVVSTLVVGSLGASPALAGGGCHSGATQGRGHTVEIVDACFTPSILHTDPGTEVTFVNQDPFVHNVSANRWGYFDDLESGSTFTARFDRPGIYPFACTYHPGMTGAIVVGDGTGAGSGEVVTLGSAEAAPRAEQAEASDTQAQATPDVGWLAGGAVGLVVGAALVLLARRRSRAG